MLTLFGKEFRKVRVDKGVTLAHLSEKFNKSITYFSGLERGKMGIKDDFLEEICNYLKIPVKQKEKIKFANTVSRFSRRVVLDGMDNDKRLFFHEFLRVFKNLDDGDIANIRIIIEPYLKKSKYRNLLK